MPKFLRDHQIAIVITLLVVFLLIFVVFERTFEALDWPDSNVYQVVSFLGNLLWQLAATLVSVAGGVFVGLLLMAVGLSVAGLLCAYLLRKSETADKGIDIDPDLDHVKSVTELENPRGFVQNHIVAVTELKTDPRWLRRLTLGFGFFWVEKLITYLYRPGLIIDMGTIHFARWFRLPGTDKLVFTSNYDGSWESYLEDFITKAQWGQTAVWGNGVGFPEVEWLFYKGAGDGARFKRWVRRQQRRTRFWYSRFPDLSTDQIRNNALICEGLAKASSDSDARAWVDLFGSRPRPAEALERSEIQSLILKGLGKYKSAELFPVRIPDGEHPSWTSWFSQICNPDIGDDGMRVSFGDNVTDDVVMTVALSAEGLDRMGLGKLQYSNFGKDSNSLASFPEAFVRGMANEGRARILGDSGVSHPEHWKWSSNDPQQDWRVEDRPAHVIVMMYGKNRAALKEKVSEEKDRLAHEYGLEVGPSIIMRDLPEDIGQLKESFGFRDGISQPIMEGTNASKTDVDPMHIVKPGEFVLGYPDNRGNFPHSPVVVAPLKDLGVLGQRPKDLPDRYPEFDQKGGLELRDFGRNGSFLIMRQMQQHSTEFSDYLEYKSAELSGKYDGLNITSEWLAAKMVGRKTNGVSLLAEPHFAGANVSKTIEAEADEEQCRNKTAKPEDRCMRNDGAPSQADNDFLFGTEDPQGLKCPYGAHIRRANPRDSLAPKSQYQIDISNRHRLLRRGRPYVKSEDQATIAQGGDPAEGLLFMCLNSDIERQFEFVQQTWMTARIFHGLEDERDPIVAAKEADENGTPVLGKFTIPTSFGPIQLDDVPPFVTITNGGYFFMPSRSAIRFLSKL